MASLRPYKNTLEDLDMSRNRIESLGDVPMRVRTNILDLSDTRIVNLPSEGLSELHSLYIQETYSLKKLASIYELPSLNKARFTYAYHCCAFKFPKEHDPDAYNEHIRRQEEINRQCTDVWKQARAKPVSLQPPQRHLLVDNSFVDDEIDTLASQSHQLQSSLRLPRLPEENRLRLRLSTLTLSASNVSLANSNSQVSGLSTGTTTTTATIKTTAVTAAPPPFDRLATNESGTANSSSSNHHHVAASANMNRNELYHDESVEILNSRFILCGTLATSAMAAQSIDCLPEPDAFNPCEDVMGYWVLRLAVWLVVCAALAGNLAVIIVLVSVRLRMAMSVPKFLQLNLATGDLCMGVYLAILASMDLKTMGSYFNHAIDWQHGLGCQVAGFISVFASELSIFTLTVITLERYYAITYSIDLNMRLQLCWAARVMCVGWALAATAASLPIFGVSSYSKTSICLPLETRDLADRLYLFILLTLNFLAFFVIFVCYVRMYMLIVSQETQATAKERTVAKRMALLVFTDFTCWGPIIFFGLTALLGVPLVSVTQSKILLVFFYPLNSMANPYLYAISTRQYRRDLLSLASRYRLWRQRAHHQSMSAHQCQNQPLTGFPPGSGGNNGNFHNHDGYHGHHHHHHNRNHLCMHHCRRHHLIGDDGEPLQSFELQQPHRSDHRTAISTMADTIECGHEDYDSTSLNGHNNHMANQRKTIIIVSNQRNATAAAAVDGGRGGGGRSNQSLANDHSICDESTTQQSTTDATNCSNCANDPLALSSRPAVKIRSILIKSKHHNHNNNGKYNGISGQTVSATDNSSSVDGTFGAIQSADRRHSSSGLVKLNAECSLLVEQRNGEAIIETRSVPRTIKCCYWQHNSNHHRRRQHQQHRHHHHHHHHHHRCRYCSAKRTKEHYPYNNGNNNNNNNDCSSYNASSVCNNGKNNNNNRDACNKSKLKCSSYSTKSSLSNGSTQPNSHLNSAEPSGATQLTTISHLMSDSIHITEIADSIDNNNVNSTRANNNVHVNRAYRDADDSCRLENCLQSSAVDNGSNNTDAKIKYVARKMTYQTPTMSTDNYNNNSNNGNEQRSNSGPSDELCSGSTDDNHNISNNNTHTENHSSPRCSRSVSRSRCCQSKHRVTCRRYYYSHHRKQCEESECLVAAALRRDLCNSYALIDTTSQSYSKTATMIKEHQLAIQNKSYCAPNSNISSITSTAATATTS
ncbi:Lutropin-choriogonadotropic hormone receptor, partial [Fragariocoptes setiger]